MLVFIQSYSFLVFKDLRPRWSVQRFDTLLNKYIYIYIYSLNNDKLLYFFLTQIIK